MDWNGDAWIANRAFDDTSSVVRIAGERARCVDRDASGAIETSTSPADVRAWGEDECVLASVPVGGPREVARAIAIDGDRGLDGASGGDAWVGLHDGQAFVEIDGLRGAVLQRVETPGFAPYSAAVGRSPIVMRNAPSPASATTSRSGNSSFVAIAVGSP